MEDSIHAEKNLMPTLQELKQRLESLGQHHLLEHLSGLKGPAQEDLVAHLSALDLERVLHLFSETEHQRPTTDSKLEPLEQVTEGSDRAADEKARQLGWQRLKDGRVAAFVVAGGQGSRLGHDGPKGTYPATPVKRKPLFQIFAEKILAVQREAGREVPFLVMTSPLNHEATVSYFQQHAHFGLTPSQVRFFNQRMLPAVGMDGQFLLESETSLFMSPDGHGGSLHALRKSGALDALRDTGIEDIFYFQVDNPLVRVLDPVFLGYHHLHRSEFSSKSVPKRSPEEKVGVLIRKDGLPAVIEYSDLPEELRESRDADGTLRYRAGNIATHILDRAFVERLTEGGRLHLPFHRAKKSIPVWHQKGEARTEPGVKFESFVFDALPKASRVLVMEVDRQIEFSPIKNPKGDDSPESSAIDQTRLFANWLEEVGIHVPRLDNGDPATALEISPLVALQAEDLRALPAPHPEAGHPYYLGD